MARLEVRGVYDKFRALLAFHQGCINNLCNFYPQDLSTAPSFMAWTVEALCHLQERNEAERLLVHVADLLLASHDLGHSGGPYYYRSAFLRDELDPDTGSSYRSNLCGTIQGIFDLHGWR